jgi:hypothetical protein
MAQKFLNGLHVSGATQLDGDLDVNSSALTITDVSTPMVKLVDTTNNLQARFRVANTYAYLSVDNPDNVAGSRLVFQIDGDEALRLDNSLNATFAGTIGASNFSGSSSGTNTGDQDLSSFLTASSTQSKYLRSDIDDTATGVITFTKKIHDYDTIPANQNLLDIGSIKIANRNDIYGNATKTIITDYVAKYENDNTGGTTVRIYVDDNILVDGDAYMVSVYYENLIGTLGIDFADETVTGNGAQTGTSSSPKSGRIYGYASKSDYTSTFRFVDINLNQGSGHEVTLHSPKVEAGTTLTDFVATERTDMPTNSMHVKELIATGGLKVIGPASHNFIQSENDYTLGFNDSTGTSQWWIKNYTNGNFAIHENGVGDKFTIAAGGAASFAGDVLTSGNIYLNNNKTIFGKNTSGSNYGLLTITSGNVVKLGAYAYTSAATEIGLGDNGKFLIGTAEALSIDNSKNATFAGNIKIKNALIDNASVTSATTTTTVASVSGTTYAAVFFDYVVYKSSNIRAGIVTACSDGTNVSFSETSTTDLGDTSDVTLSVVLNGSNFELRATTTSSTWNIKSLIRAI